MLECYASFRVNEVPHEVLNFLTEPILTEASRPKVMEVAPDLNRVQKTLYHRFKYTILAKWSQ